MNLLLQAISIIKVSQKNKHFCCNVPSSKFILSFLRVLLAHGLISGFVCSENKSTVFLRYNKKGIGILEKIIFCSTPGKKVLEKKVKILKQTKFWTGFIISSTSGISIVYTKTNIMPNTQRGGEIICKF